MAKSHTPRFRNAISSDAIKDIKSALAKDPDDPETNYYMLRCYLKGIGTPVNINKAKEYVRKAKKFDEDPESLGPEIALLERERQYDGKHGSKKNVGELYALAVDYQKQRNPEFKAQAVAVLKLAADRNMPETESAFYELARCYATGDGVKKDIAVAEKLLKDAREIDQPSPTFSASQVATQLTAKISLLEEALSRYSKDPAKRSKEENAKYDYLNNLANKLKAEKELIIQNNTSMTQKNIDARIKKHALDTAESYDINDIFAVKYKKWTSSKTEDTLVAVLGNKTAIAELKKIDKNEKPDPNAAMYDTKRGVSQQSFLTRTLAHDPTPRQDARKKPGYRS